MATRTGDRRRERGQITAFVAVFAVALMFVAGLVIDGGYALAARRRAANEAAGAARAGAQALDTGAYRGSGDLGLDHDAARASARQYLVATGHDAGSQVDVDGRTVSVRVTFEQPMQILGIGGWSSMTVSGQGRARNARGLAVEE